MENLRPLHDKILIQQTPPVDKIGSLYTPDRAKDWPPEGIVVAVGPGRLTIAGVREPMPVAVGDRVLFERRPSTEVESLRGSDSERFVMLSEPDIVAVIDP